MSYGVNQPCGLQAYSYINMTPFNGSFAMVKMDPNNLPAAMWSGDLVQLVNGYVKPFDAGTITSDGPALGVFVGCQYQSANNIVPQKAVYPLWWGGTGVQVQPNTPIWAKVYIDNNILFNAQMDNASGITDDQAQGFIGKYCQYVQAPGNSVTGQSSSYLKYSTVGSDTNYKLEIVDITPDPNNYIPTQGLIATVYTNFIVKINSVKSNF